MEEATGGKESSLLNKILPPRLEDAGLEDCALPPESIKEAFLKAATAVKSRATSLFADDADEGDCVKDPWPSASDVVVGVSPGTDTPGPCATGKGGGRVPEASGDDVVEKGDKVVGVGIKEDGEACVDGLKGLGIEEKKVENSEDDEEEDERDGERPILVEGFVA